MNIINIYYSQTGNTEKVAKTIEQTALDQGCDVLTLAAGKKAGPVSLIDYDLAFIGSGVYAWLPGKPMHGTRDLIPSHFQGFSSSQFQGGQPATYLITSI